MHSWCDPYRETLTPARSQELGAVGELGGGGPLDLDTKARDQL